MHRVLKANGLLMFSSFGPDTLKELRSAYQSADSHAHVHRFIDMHDVGDMLIGAGFADPEIEHLALVWPYEDTDAHWSFTLKLAGPLADVISKLDEDEREAIRADVKSRIEAALELRVGSCRVGWITRRVTI